MKFLIAVFLILMLVVSQGAKLPSTFKKCDKKKSDFNKCLSDAIHDAIQKLNKPMPDYGLTSLETIRIPYFKSEYGNSSYGLHQIYSELTFIGLNKPSKTEANLDFSTKTLKLKLTYPKVKMETKFEGQGKIVLLPTDVTTKLHVFFENTTFDFTFEMEEYGSSTKFWRVTKSDLKISTKKMALKYDGLFENKELNEEFNAAVSEKSLEIFDQYRERVRKLAQFFALMFKSFLETVPVVELFDGMK